MMTTFQIPNGTVTGSSSRIADAPPQDIPSPQPDAPTEPWIYTARLLAIRELRDFTQHLSGRLKTLIDASTSDRDQRKALKDLIHDMLWAEHYQAATEWAERQSDSERRIGIPVHYWEDLAEAAIVASDDFFAATTLPE
jgi:hypothetical protein